MIKSHRFSFVYSSRFRRDSYFIAHNRRADVSPDNNLSEKATLVKQNPKVKGRHKYAIVATANKIATIYYIMLTTKTEFIPVDVKKYRQQYNQAKISFLERKLAMLKANVAA